MQYGDNAFGQLIRISYRPPRFLVYLLTCTHLGAIFSLTYADLSNSVVYMGLALILLSFSSFYLRFRQARNELVSPVLCLNKKNEWLLNTEGSTYPLRLRPAAYVHPGLVILRFFGEGKKSWCFILTRENVDEQSFRRLRVRLLHGETG